MLSRRFYPRQYNASVSQCPISSSLSGSISYRTFLGGCWMVFESFLFHSLVSLSCNCPPFPPVVPRFLLLFGSHRLLFPHPVQPIHLLGMILGLPAYWVGMAAKKVSSVGQICV